MFKYIFVGKILHERITYTQSEWGRARAPSPYFDVFFFGVCVCVCASTFAAVEQYSVCSLAFSCARLMAFNPARTVAAIQSYMYVVWLEGRQMYYVVCIFYVVHCVQTFPSLEHPAAVAAAVAAATAAVATAPEA